MRRNYHILGKDHTEELSEYLSRDGQLLLPLVELLETAEIAVDDLIDNAGRSTIEAVMKILAQDMLPKPNTKGNAEARTVGIDHKRVFSVYRTVS